jgi:catechol 2,3-dioxygenase-like lactoylglutathione lyase family enzyme
MSGVLVAILTCRFSPTYAPDMTIPALRIQTITIPVADQERSLAFYRDVLGFEVTADEAFGDQRWITVAPTGSSVAFTLHPPFPGQAAPGWQQGIVLHTGDVPGVVAGLRAAGVRIDDPERQGWGLQTQFSDPDGNGFVLLQQGETEPAEAEAKAKKSRWGTWSPEEVAAWKARKGE